MAIRAPFSAVCDIIEMDGFCLKLIKNLSAGTVITLSGDLGSGKTTFTRMLAKHLLIKSAVSSPTYSYLNIYDEKMAHFDLYRLCKTEDFFSLGFEEYLLWEAITVIEWPEIIMEHLPKNAINLSFSHYKNKRRITSHEAILI